MIDDIATTAGPALIYCRVSKSGWEGETSLDSQKSLCVAHAGKLGYTVARVTEEAFSGAVLFDRPLLARDRADIRRGQFRAVIAYAVDRLTRDASHLAILEDECERSGCRLIFVTEASAGGEALRPDEAYAAGVERRQIRERTQRGRRAKLLRGEPVFTGWELYGYRADREAGRYRVYEPEAEIVRRIFSMRAAGQGMHCTASTFNREGLPSPKSDQRPGARWTSSTISDLLNTRSYMGEEICWKTRQSPNGRHLPRPESERVRLPDGIRPAIVSRELWEACQGQIRMRAEKMRRSKEHPALLRSHIFCAECGARMIRNHFRRGPYEYLKYRCGSRWRPFDTGCKGRPVMLEAAHEWAWNKVKAILLDPDIVGRVLELSSPDPQLLSDLRAVKREHERTGRGLRALVRVRDSGDDPDLRPFIEREVARATREIRQLEKSITELNRRIGTASQSAADLRSLHNDRALDCTDPDRFTFDERRLALKALGFRVYANGDDQNCWRYEIQPSRAGGSGR